MIYLIFVIYFFFRLYPYLFSPVPTGYDGGLYVYLWNHSLDINWLRTIYPPLIFYFGKLLNLFVSPENYLIPISFVISFCLFYSIYLYTKNKWTLFIFSISAIQYRFWWWFYIKNILAASFIFFYLFLDNKKSKYKYIFPVLIPLLHQPTAIIFFFILLIQKSYRSIILFLISFAVYYIPNYATTIQPYLKYTATTFGVESGTFYGFKESILLMLPYLPFAFFGLINNFRQKKSLIINYSLLISLVFPLFGLFLSRRFIPLFDLFAIILAGEYISKINYKKFLILIYLIFISIFVFKTSSALIKYDEFSEIKLIKDTPPNSSILVTDNAYTPWVYGYSQRRTIAPGFGENDIYWSSDDWQKYWLSGNQKAEINLLNRLPQPLYIWQGDMNVKSKFSLQGDCFKRFSWHLFEFVCNK